MSMDHPFYEELCRRKHRAARCWLVGDLLYYLGLIPAMMAISAALAAFFAGLIGYDWGWLIAAAVAFVICASVFWIGGRLKKHAYDLAARDGIDRGAGWGRSDQSERTR